MYEGYLVVSGLWRLTSDQ